MFLPRERPHIEAAAVADAGLAFRQMWLQDSKDRDALIPDGGGSSPTDADAA